MSTTLKLTVAEDDGMVAKGAFDDLTQKVELINGEIQAMNPAGPAHDDYIQNLNLWSVQITDPSQVRVRIQSGLSFPELDSRTEPDVAWVKARRYLDHHPTSHDVLLLMEVSHSSLKSDQQDKETLYAKAGIAEYGIVDIVNECLHVHRDPKDGTYSLVTVLKPGQSVTPLVQPEAELLLADLFGKK